MSDEVESETKKLEEKEEEEKEEEEKEVKEEEEDEEEEKEEEDGSIGKKIYELTQTIKFSGKFATSGIIPRCPL